jgi:PAS domain S-box-containing protein
MFDQIELKRFGIDSARLPKGSVVINALPSPPSRYFWSIAGFSVLALAEGLLILALIRNTRRYKTSQEQLRQSEEKYRVLFNIFPLGLTLTDRVGNIVETNETAAKLLGIPRAEHLARSFDSEQWSIIRPDGTSMPPEEYAAVRALRENRPVENVEMGVVRPNATVIWINVTAAPLHLKQYGVVVAYGDITERKRAEEALAAHERKYRDLFEANQDGISLFRINPDRTPAPFLDVNEAAAALVGYSRHELAEMTVMDVEQAVSPEIIDQRLATLEQTGQVRFETVLIAKDQREIPVEVLARTINYEDGLAVMNIVRDISERKQAEAALRASLAEKEVLLREVHHRVKNNLAAIVGLFDLQRQAMDDPQAVTVLAELSCRIRSMSLVHEKLYRSDSLASIDFQEYLQSLISHLRTSFGTARIRCDIAAQGVLMPLDLAVPCGMIINELVTNALKYAFPENGTHPGNGDCRIHVAVSHDHTTFTLSVADNGIGLPADFDWSTAKTLGLTLVRMLGQHQLGGRYEVDLRQGTRFTLTFTPRNRNHAHA